MPDVPPEILDRPFADMRPFLEYTRWLGFHPESIVDVGANRGRWTEMALEVWPDAHCLLIEPQPEMRDDLDALCARQPNVRWVEAGAGPEETELVQTIWDDLEGSSFLPAVDPQRLAAGSQRPVRMRRLDDMIAEWRRSPDLVKLDVQGFELEVLKGAPSLFGTAELFVLETSLFRFFDNLPLLREVIEFMSARGYEVYDLAGRIRRPVDGALGQIDVAFALGRGRLRQHEWW
jgi:FkbM family methyltransferase